MQFILDYTIDALTSSFNGIRIILHKIQGIHLNFTEIPHWTNESINNSVYGFPSRDKQNMPE